MHFCLADQLRNIDLVMNDCRAAERMLLLLWTLRNFRAIAWGEYAWLFLASSGRSGVENEET